MSGLLSFVNFLLETNTTRYLIIIRYIILCDANVVQSESNILIVTRITWHVVNPVLPHETGDNVLAENLQIISHIGE